MGSEFLRQILYGKETSHGGGAAATRKWLGEMNKLGKDTTPKYPKEQFGRRAESYRAIAGKRLYNNTLLSEDGSFEHLPVLFGCGLKGGVTATEQTTGQHDYLWDFSPSFTGNNSPDSLALQIGDDVQAWLAKYVMFEKIHISGQISQAAGVDAVKIESDFFGQSIETTTFTASINPPTNMEPMNAKLARLFIDTTWAGVGTTELANLLTTFDIEILTGVHPVFRGSSNNYFDKHAESYLGVMGTFTIEGGSSANNILAALRSQALAVARFEINGNQIGSGNNSLFSIDFSGHYSDADPIASSDRGDTLATFTIQGTYDQTGASMMENVKVVTDINAY
jgi:hypothetical protein